MSQRTYYSEEARQKAQIKTIIVVGICLALGATIGTAIAMLFAPKSGEEMRDELVHSLEEQAERGRKASEGAFKRLEKQVDDMRKQIEERIS